MVPFLARFRESYERVTLPLGRMCLRLGLAPDMLTYTSLALGGLAGLLLAYRHWALSIAMIMLVGVTDVLDGATARAGGQANPYGTVLDHTMDRYVEFFVLLGVLASGAVDAVWIVFTLFGMVMASYVRARAEATGLVESCNVGLAGRQEKIGLLLVGLVAQIIVPAWGILRWAVIGVGVMSHITAAQRLAYTRRTILGEHPRGRMRKEPEAV